MKVIQIYCGCISSVGSEDEMATMIRLLAAEYFPAGHTLIEATGRWSGPISGTIDERTIIVEVWEVDGFNPPPAAKFAIAYKNMAEQESVVIIEKPCEAIVF